MAIYDDKWFEIWYSDGVETIPTHILLVVSDKRHLGKIRVVDPFKDNKIVFEGKNYEEVCSWLWEDEYHLMNGREFPDDGW